MPKAQVNKTTAFMIVMDLLNAGIISLDQARDLIKEDYDSITMKEHNKFFEDADEAPVK